jgi:serine/threonine protein kinase
MRIVGFETVNNEKEIDYILSLEGIELNRSSYILRPMIYNRISQNVSIGDFTLVKCLGSGGFSQVFLVKGIFNNRYYAMKLMSKKFITDS